MQVWQLSDSINTPFGIVYPLINGHSILLSAWNKKSENQLIDWKHTYSTLLSHVQSINLCDICQLRHHAVSESLPHLGSSTSDIHGAICHAVAGSFVDVLVAVGACRPNPSNHFLQCQHYLTPALGLSVTHRARTQNSHKRKPQA